MTLYRTSGDTKLSTSWSTPRATASRSRWWSSSRRDSTRRRTSAGRRGMEEAGVHVTYGVVGLKTHSQDHPGGAEGLQRAAALRARRHRQLPRRHGPPVLRPRPAHQRRGPGPRRHRALQLPDDRLHARAQVPQAAAVAAHAQDCAAQQDRARAQAAHGRQAGAHPVQDERPGGRGHRARALRGRARRRAGRPHRPRHLPVPAGPSRAFPSPRAWSASSAASSSTRASITSRMAARRSTSSALPTA